MHLQHGIYNPTRNGSPMLLLECLLVVPTSTYIVHSLMCLPRPKSTAGQAVKQKETACVSYSSRECHVNCGSVIPSEA